PRSTKAAASRFWSKVTTSFMLVSSGRRELANDRQLSEEQCYQSRIPLTPSTARKDLNRLFRRAPWPVWAVVDQSVVGVADRNNPGEQRDVRPSETVRIA